VWAGSLSPVDAYSVKCEGEEYDSKADIQRRGSILAWIVILSVYGADTITEVKLFLR
jgi:hypothetical protein